MHRCVTSIVVVALALIPAIISFDYGGVLTWTQYVASLATLPLAAVVVMIAIGGAFGWPDSVDRRRQDTLAAAVPALWLALLVFTAAYVALQLAPLSAEWVAAASPGSAKAYLEWSAPLTRFASETSTPKIPISVLVDGTWMSLGRCLMVLSFAMLGLEVLKTRSTLTLFLATVSIGTAVHAMLATLGISFVPQNTQISFGGFVNRNNAALFLNLGIASSLALLVARLSDLSGAWMGQGNAGGIDFGGLARDTTVWIATICLAFQSIGVAVCGSRGGLLSMLAAGALTLVATCLPRRMLTAITVLIVPLVIAIAVVLSPGVQLRSIERLLTLSAGDSGQLLVKNSRILHWRDSLSAARDYFPAGSGAGTYEYAYLPYQATGGEQWFRHADNVYVELLVELGLVGILLVVGICVLLTVALVRLRASSDPADQSLFVLGTYAGVAVAVSQFVDFGILIPANTLLCATLGTVVVARSAALRQDRSPSKDGATSLRLMRYRTIGWPLRMAFGCSAVTASTLALLILNPYATVQGSAATGKAILQQFPSDGDRLAEQVTAMHAVSDRVVTEESAMIQAKCIYRIARLEEIGRIVSEQQVRPERAWEMTRPGRRQIGKPSGLILERYQESRQWARKALMSAPLSIEPRAYLIYTDFVDEFEVPSQAWIEQLARLQRRNGRQLLRLANLAAYRDRTDLVEECCRRATGLSDAFVPRAIEIALDQQSVDLGNAISDHPIATRAAASRLFALLRQGAPRKEDIETYLKHNVDRLRCEETISSPQRAVCEQLAGELQFYFGRVDQAIKHYETAIQWTPTNRVYRAEFIRRLLQSDRIEMARAQLDQAAKLFPDDATFDRLKLQIDQQRRLPAPDDFRSRRTEGTDA